MAVVGGCVGGDGLLGGWVMVAVVMAVGGLVVEVVAVVGSGRYGLYLVQG